MVDLYQSSKNVLAKPDIITCNSVLNACAYEHAATENDKKEIMERVVETFEFFQMSAPKYGWPNHMTFAHVLLAIARHMSLDDPRRIELAKTTFWQCCERGHVSVLVVTHLHSALPWDDFAQLMGEALFSGEGKKLGFNLRKLPREWTRFAPSPKERYGSRPSKKHPSLEVTKAVLAKQQKRQ